MLQTVSKSLKDVLTKNNKASSSSSSEALKKKKSFNKFKSDKKSPSKWKGDKNPRGDKNDSGDKQIKNQPGDGHGSKQSKDKRESKPRPDGSNGAGKHTFKSSYHHAKRVIKKPLTPAERKAAKPHFKLVSELV